jgi:hypothetical protein
LWLPRYLFAASANGGKQTLPPPIQRNSSFVQRARRNLPYWEQAFAQAEEEFEMVA